ncbi:hypothetical protein NL676_030037, partial [Syzygium grande]
NEDTDLVNPQFLTDGDDDRDNEDLVEGKEETQGIPQKGHKGLDYRGTGHGFYTIPIIYRRII